ncbi:MAG: PQQ-binding-like beta-propeller repeat protein, partial [Planctomycetota bacterium]
MRHADALILLLVLATPTWSQEGKVGDWPQWRGPDRDGVSTESGWSVKGKPDNLWLTNVGSGYSTVSIVDGRIYTMGHDAEEQKDTIWCIDAEEGSDIWSHSFPARTMARMHGGGTLSTPSVDGERVFVSNREGKMFCLSAKSGKVRWSKDLREEHGLRLPTWGLAASPLVLDDMVVMNVGLVLAFDKDGELIWQSQRNYGHCYSTPVDITLNGRPRLAVFGGEGLVILDRKSGEELAFHEFRNRSRVNAATPVVLGNKIFISSGYNKGCAMLEASEDGLELL